MSGLYKTLNVGAESLFSSRQGVDTAGHNIANAQTEGYSRQRVNLETRTPTRVRGNYLIGNGAYVNTIKRAHDQFTETQINSLNKDVGNYQELHSGLRALELIYSPELANSVVDELTNFFNSLQNLSNTPDDYTIRTNVVETAKNLTMAFRRVDGDLKNHVQGINQQLGKSAEEVNNHLRSIAELNSQIATGEAGGLGDANDLRDQRDRLVREMSKKLDIHYYEDQHGMILIRGPSEVTLVDGKNASQLVTTRNADNPAIFDIKVKDWEGHSLRDLTSSIRGGEMKAFIDLRDKVIPTLLSKNNEMAHSLSTNFNAIHREGFGINEYTEAQGRNFFKEPQNIATAAESIAIDDTISNSVDAISAASSRLAPGDNVNANRLLNIKDAPLLENATITLNNYYGNYVGKLGLEIQKADHLMESSEILHSDLNKRREAVSGVSLDEEATNLIRWQSSFTASSKLITTVDEMLETVLSLKR